MARLATPLYTNNQLITTAWANAYWRDNEAAHWPFTNAGDMAQATAADVIARLPVGTRGEMLVVNAGETAFEWAGLLHAQIKNTNAQTIVNNTYTTVTLDETDIDVDGFVAAPTLNEIIIPTNYAGYYMILWTINWDTNPNGYRYGGVMNNGVTIENSRLRAKGGDIDSDIQAGCVEWLDEGDVLTLRALQNRGGDLDTQSAYLSASLVKGGAA